MVAPLIDRTFLYPSDLNENFRLKLSAGTRDGYEMTLGNFLDYLGITPTVAAYGAVGDGTTDDSSALLLSDASADAENLFPAGTYCVASDITLTKSCRFLPGAKLKVASGKTVIFKNNVDADHDGTVRSAARGRAGPFVARREDRRRRAQGR